jgi:small subunit ribosomal protein S2
MEVTLEQMMESGMHHGHPTRYLHPKISLCTCGVKNGIYLIDLVQTRHQLTEAQRFVIEVRKAGKAVMFVGTGNQSAQAVKDRAESSQSFFVNERWLGGILTNSSTVQASLRRYNQLELKQKDSSWSHVSLQKKKEVIALWKRLKRYLGGLKGIQSLPGAVVIVGQTTELAAVRECRKLGIPVICRLDTDCDPSLAEIGVPINDDSPARVRLFLEALSSSICEGRRWRLQKKV